MRFRLPARQVVLAPVLGLALVAAATACSSSGSSSSTTPPPPSAVSAPPTPVPSSGAQGTGSTSSAVAQITANWEKFFASSTPVSQKVTLLQNGSTFSSAITALAALPLASGIGAKVSNVVLNSATTATVTYDIVAGGSTLLANQSGQAVLQNGVWKVGDASLCGLFKLVPGGSVPSACKSVS